MRAILMTLAAIGAAHDAGENATAPHVASMASSCTDITGFLDDPTGHPVYAAPDFASRLLGRILGPSKSDVRGVQFTIREAHDEWLRVTGAADDPELTGKPARRMYAGTGWIRGEGVSVAPQASRAFARPDFASAEVLRTAGNAWLDTGMIAIVACDGAWVCARWRPTRSLPMRYTPAAVVSRHPLAVEGWVTGICNIAETTCDGLDGEHPSKK